MLNPTLYFFLLTKVERPRIRTAQITTHSAGYRDFGRVVITTARTRKPFARTVKFAVVTTLITLIDWCIGTVVRNSAVAIVPNVFQRFHIALHVRKFAVTNKTTTRDLRVRHFKVNFVVWVDLLLYIEMETVRVVTFLCNTFQYTKLFCINAAESAA